ncbi:MAG: 50S ribosomal protein L23 [Planctomycetes bacterium]|nr:50S ribosomal protein L23 [Planctomycetota bacterium]
MDWHQVLIRPLITEKGTTALAKEGTRLKCYAFEVNRLATKEEIRAAMKQMVLEMCDKEVDVRRVNTMKVHGKFRRRGMRWGVTADTKKALVFIPREQGIDLF